ncbi:MAG: PilZ domain-containing protein [Candidatus Omnitrophota bacterium]|nr:PilZ domain-containing protein [Candidatus Omnitrophota bacterium]
MGWAGINTRKSVRVSFECTVIVKKARSSLVFRSATENMSVGGVCVILEKELLKNTPVEVELSLPDDLPPAKCTGKIMWSAKRNKYTKKKSSQFDTGIEFIEVSDRDRSRMKRIIDELLGY